jgi:hypothetical protein
MEAQMANNTVLQTIYKNEFVDAFEQKQSWLRGLTTTEGEVKGNQFVWPLKQTTAQAVERASNGEIPVQADNQTSVTGTLKEYHYLTRKTNFNIFGSSVDQRKWMQEDSIRGTNKLCDQLILAQLMTGTNNSGTAAALTAGIAVASVAALFANYVPNDGELFGLLTPKAWAQLMRVKEFTSGDWLGWDTKEFPFMSGVRAKEWLGVKWIMAPFLSGVGTSSAKCVIWHKYAIGHAINQGELSTMVDYNSEQDYSWARTSTYQGSKLLRNEGVYIINHDDTATIPA